MNRSDVIGMLFLLVFAVLVMHGDDLISILREWVRSKRNRRDED